MSLPTPGDVHVNVPLTNMSVAYLQSLDGFAADRLAPINPSDKQSNIWYKFTKSYWFRNAMQKRPPGAQAAEAGYGLVTDSFFADVWAVKKPIADQTRSNEDSPLSSDRNAMQFLSRLERINREVQFAATALQTGVWAQDVTGVAAGPTATQVLQWNDAAATPLTDIAKWKNAMLKSTGFAPNVLSIGPEVWEKVQFNSQILARVNGGSTNGNPAVVTKQLVAQLMGLEELIVAEAVQNTDPERGTDTMTGAFITGKVGLLLYRDETMGPEVATAIKTFTWQQYAGARNGIRIKKYRTEPTASDNVEIESAYVHKIVATDLGTFFTALVA